MQLATSSLVIIDIFVGLAAILTRNRLEFVTVIDLEVRVIVEFESVLLVLVHLVHLNHANLIHHDFALDSAF